MQLPRTNKNFGFFSWGWGTYYALGDDRPSLRVLTRSMRWGKRPSPPPTSTRRGKASSYRLTLAWLTSISGTASSVLIASVRSFFDATIKAVSPCDCRERKREELNWIEGGLRRDVRGGGKGGGYIIVGVEVGEKWLWSWQIKCKAHWGNWHTPSFIDQLLGRVRLIVTDLRWHGWRWYGWRWYQGRLAVPWSPRGDHSVMPISRPCWDIPIGK